jgi:hypothetical protein
MVDVNQTEICFNVSEFLSQSSSAETSDLCKQFFIGGFVHVF